MVHFDRWGPARVQSLSVHKYLCGWLSTNDKKKDLRFSLFFNCFTRWFRLNSIRMCVFCGLIMVRSIFLKKFLFIFLNGVAERKNQHLLEVSRSLLINMHVPKDHKGDALLIACYLINCNPSSFLNGKTPDFVLFTDAPLFVVPPRVFGVLALFIY
ncbi:hypothetical protein AMTRI_Chr09g41800 [Amborella trichopoda]